MGNGWRSTKLNPALPALVLNVPWIAGKTADHVDRLLGRSAATSTSRDRVNGDVRQYRGGGVQIAFQGDKAARIVLRDARALTFDQHALAKLGLRPAKPTAKESEVLRWKNLFGLREVSVYSNGRGGVSHVYIDVGLTDGNG
jgi:hypothetical protein